MKAKKMSSMEDSAVVVELVVVVVVDVRDLLDDQGGRVGCGEKGESAGNAENDGIADQWQMDRVMMGQRGRGRDGDGTGTGIGTETGTGTG